MIFSDFDAAMGDFTKHELLQLWKWRHLLQVFYLVTTVKNWFDVLLMHFGFKKPSFIKLRNGLAFVAYPQNYNAVDMFHNQPYKRLDVKGRTTLDIAGFVGDSALYFVNRGAREVIL